MTNGKNFKIKYMKIFCNNNVIKCHTKVKVFLNRSTVKTEQQKEGWRSWHIAWKMNRIKLSREIVFTDVLASTLILITLFAFS